MKKSKIIILIIVLLLIILSIFTVIKINEYNTLINIANANINKIDSKNYFYEVNNVTENSSFKIWVKDSKIKYQVFTNNNLTQTLYVDLTNNSTYIVNEENKAYSINENDALIQPVYINSPDILVLAMGMSIDSSISFLDKIPFVYSIKSITSETLDNKNTIKVIYKLDDVIETTWFDSTTLHPIKSESTLNTNSTYKVTDCDLSDEEIIFNDIENYNKV